MSNKQIVIKEEIITALDKAAGDYQLAVADATPFKKAFMLADAMNNMRSLLTNEVMQPIMALMNTDLGFRTDKDPRVWNTKKNAWNEPYAVEVVRDVMVEAILRGFFPVNNELNIIAGRFYAAKNGVRRKVQNWPGLTDLKDTRGVPRVLNGGAIVQTSAAWKLNGKADAIEIEIAVKVNDMMGTDAILGKAERKQMKLILDRISGEVTPDGDVDDVPLGTSPEEPPKKTKVETTKTKAVTGTDKTLPSDGGAKHDQPVAQKPAESPTSPQQEEAVTSQATAQTQDLGSAEFTDAEKKEIFRQEGYTAAREMLVTDAPTALTMMMDVDGITKEELKAVLDFYKVKLAKEYTGPESISAKTIATLISERSWVSVITLVNEQIRSKL